MLTPYYMDETTTIYLADNREALPLLPSESVDMVFTSPPYNLGNTTGGGFPDRLGHYRKSTGLAGRGGDGKWAARKKGTWGGGALANGYGTCDDNMPHDEYVARQQSLLSECWRLLVPAGAVFYNHKPRVLDGQLVSPFDYVPADLQKFIRQVVIWKRSGGVNFSPAFYLPMHEWVVIIARRAFRLKSQGASGVGDVWDIHQERDSAHPAPFPVELPRRALETTDAQTILDPFMGSGTVGVACAILGRKFIGIELEKSYCDLAVARIKRAKGIPATIPRLNRRQIETPLLDTLTA
jgi:site-specific DNA-methyltransferase (adenine-specific)